MFSVTDFSKRMDRFEVPFHMFILEVSVGRFIFSVALRSISLPDIVSIKPRKFIFFRCLISISLYLMSTLSSNLTLCLELDSMYFFSHSRKCLLNLLYTHQSKILYQKYLIIFDYLFFYFNNFSMPEE